MAWLYVESETSSAMHRATSDYGHKTFLNLHENAESDSKMENFNTALARAEWVILLLFITLACGGVHGVLSFSQPAAAVKSSSFRKRPTPGLVRTYGGDREMYREVATLRMLMSWTSTPDSGTLYGTRIAHRMAESSYTSAECTNPSINQVSRRIL